MGSSLLRYKSDWDSAYTTVNSTSATWDAASAAASLATQTGGGIFVCPSGSDVTGNGSRANPYRSISHAMGTITGASANTPYVIRVLCGIIDDVPFETKPYVFIQGTNQSGTRIRAISADTPFIKLGSISTLDNVTILGPTSSAAVSAVGASCAIRECSIRPNGTAVEGQYALYADLSAGVRLDSCNITNCDVGLYVTDNALVRSFETDFRSCQAGIKANGSSELDIRANAIYTSTSAIVGINAENIHMLNMHIEDCDYGIIGDGTSVMDGSMVHIHEHTAGSTIYDVWQKDGNSKIDIDSAKFNMEKMSFENTENVFINIDSELVGDEAKVFLEELHVGIPEQGRESVFGEGDSYIRDTLCWVYDADTGQYTNVSLSARSATGSVFYMPSAQNSYLYMASDLKSGGSGDYLQHYGIKTSTNNTITFDTSADIIDTEYYNGSAWVEFSSMMAGGNAPYLTYGHDLFTVSGSNQIRYDQNIATLWTANSAVPDGSGVNRYWIRLHALSALTNPIEFEQIKLHTNRYEINEDGWVEYFGKARPIHRMPINWVDIRSGTGAAVLGGVNVSPSPNILVTRTRNEFAGAGDYGVFTFPVPHDMDTSCPLVFEGCFILDNPAGADITFNIVYLWTQDGDYISDVTAASTSSREEKTLTLTLPQATLNTAEKVYWGSVNLDLAEVRARRTNGSGVEHSDLVWVKIERTDADATADVIMVDAFFKYTKWCEGGHF